MHHGLCAMSDWCLMWGEITGLVVFNSNSSKKLPLFHSVRVECPMAKEYDGDKSKTNTFFLVAKQTTGLHLPKKTTGLHASTIIHFG